MTPGTHRSMHGCTSCGKKRLSVYSLMLKAGELLCRVDLQAIRDAGLSTVIPFLITNPEITKELKPTQAASAIGGQSVILEYRL